MTSRVGAFRSVKNTAEGRADPGAAQVTELVERARHDCLTDVAACAEQARAGGVERQLDLIESPARRQDLQGHPRRSAAPCAWPARSCPSPARPG